MKKIWTKLDLPNVMLWIGLLLIMFFPWLLTRTWGLFHFDNRTGVIGDTIGGITAPISGFLGAFLVYMALKEQIKANKIITDQFKSQKKDEAYKQNLLYITERLKMLREDIKDYEIIAHVSKTERRDFPNKETVIVTHRGVEAIAFALQQYKYGTPSCGKSIDSEINPHLVQIKYFLGTVLYLLKDCLNEQKYEITDRANLCQMVIETYRSKLYPFLEKNEALIAPVCDRCKERHKGLPPSIFALFYEINKLIESLKIPV